MNGMEDRLNERLDRIENRLEGVEGRLREVETYTSELRGAISLFKWLAGIVITLVMAVVVRLLLVAP